MWFSTKQALTIGIFLINILSVNAIGAVCEHKADKAVAKWFSFCAPDMRVAACCPPSHPVLAQSEHPEPTIKCVTYEDVAETKIRPVAPTKCEKGWQELPFLGGLCLEGDTLPQAYIEQRCRL